MFCSAYKLPLSALVTVILRTELSSQKTDYWQGERKEFCGCLLVEMVLERKKRTEISWFGEILLFINEGSTGEIKLEIKEEQQEKNLYQVKSLYSESQCDDLKRHWLNNFQLLGKRDAQTESN